MGSQEGLKKSFCRKNNNSKKSFKIGWEWAVYNRRAAWMLTHEFKLKQKQKKPDNNDNVELPPPPRQHGQYCFANVSERTTSTSSQLRLSRMFRLHPG